MATTVIYKCDRCGHSQENDTNEPRTMFDAGVKVEWRSNNKGPMDMTKTYVPIQGLFCRDCVEAMGFLRRPEQQVEGEEFKAPTLEEQIVSIVEAVIEDRGLTAQ